MTSLEGGAKNYINSAKNMNGHKYNCKCVICKNILRKALNKGYIKEGPSNKKNGHKHSCKCPICKNINNQKSKKNHIMNNSNCVFVKQTKSKIRKNKKTRKQKK
jgi:hypothetical protein